MARTLRESVVVITGASSGIGRATALAFAREGASIVVAARREGPLRELARECDHHGARCLAQPTDVTDEQAVRALAQRAVEEFGRLDVWVNNAGVLLFGRFEDTPPDDWRRVIETNVFGYVHGARAALPIFRQQGHGTLINVASVEGKIGAPWVTAYATSKFAVVGLSESLREELLDQRDVDVCTILPASTDTPLFQHAGNYTGRTPQPPPPVYSADEVAAAILACARAPQREVFVGNARSLTGRRRIAPPIAERLFARLVDRAHFEDERAARTPGNLFHPVDYGTGVAGGWHGRERTALRSMLLALGGAAAVGVGAWWLWRRFAPEDLGGRLADVADRGRTSFAHLVDESRGALGHVAESGRHALGQVAEGGRGALGQAAEGGRHALARLRGDGDGSAVRRLVGATALATGLEQLTGAGSAREGLARLGRRAAGTVGRTAAQKAVETAVDPVVASAPVQEGIRGLVRGAGDLLGRARDAVV